MSRFRGNPRFGGPGGGPPRHMLRGTGPPRGGRGGFQAGRQPQNLMMAGPGPRGPPSRGGTQGREGNNFNVRGSVRWNNRPSENSTSGNSSTSPSSSNNKSDTRQTPAGPAVVVKVEPVSEEVVQKKPDEVEKKGKDKPSDSAPAAETVQPSKSASVISGAVTAESADSNPDQPMDENAPHLTEVYISEYLCDLYLNVDKDGVTGTPHSASGFDCLWASLRSTHGVSGSKVAFEVLALELTSTSTDHNACVLRVGWSHDDLDISLGENGTSWGYGGTAKKSHDNKYLNYGDKYEVGDAITCYIDLDSKAKTISFAKNGKHFGAAFTLKPEDTKKPLFPSVSTKNFKFLVNFGQQPTKYPLLDGYKMIAFTSAKHIHPCMAGPATMAEAEFVLMIGLPAAGKSTWCESHSAAHPDKRYNILGTNLIMEKMKVTGLTRKRNYHGRWEELIQKATGILNTLFKIVERKLERFPRNIILDQTNVYESARRRKLRNFQKFGRKVAVVIVNNNEELNTRNAKREKEEGKFVPESAVMEMKANFRVPTLEEGLTEIQYIEMDEGGAKKQIEEYVGEGKTYKTGGGRRAPTDKPKHGEKRMPEKPPFEDKLNKRPKQDNEQARSDAGRPRNDSRDKSNDRSRDERLGERSRSGSDRPNRSFEDKKKEGDRREFDKREDRGRRVERGGGARGGFSVTVDRRDDNRPGSKNPDRGRSGDKFSDRLGRGDGDKFNRRDDRDNRGDRNKDDQKDSRFTNRDSDNRAEGGFNRDSGGFRGGSTRGRDVGREETRGRENRPNRFANTSQFGGGEVDQPKTPQGNPNQPGNQRDNASNNQFGGGSSNQFGAGQGNRFGAGPGNQFGAGKGNQFGAGKGNQFAAGQANQFSAGQTNQFGAGQANQLAAGQANQFGAGQGNQFGARKGNQLGAGQGNKFGGSRSNVLSSSPSDSFMGKPPVKIEPMDRREPNYGSGQYNSGNNRDYPVKSEPRDHDSSYASKPFGATMTDYNTPETKQYGVQQDVSTSYSSPRDRLNQKQPAYNSGNQHRDRFSNQSSADFNQQPGGFNQPSDLNQPPSGYSQSGGFSQQSSGSNQQSRSDTPSWKQNQGSGGYNQPTQHQGSGEYSQSQSSSGYAQPGNRFGHQDGKGGHYDDGGTSSNYNNQPNYSGSQPQGQQQSTSYNSQQSFGQSFGDTQRKSYGDTQTQSYGDTQKQNYGDTQKQSYGDSQRQSYGDTQRQGYGDTQRQSYGDTQKQSYGDTKRQSYGDTQRQSYGDNQGQVQSLGDYSSSYEKKDEPRSGSYGEQTTYQSFNSGPPAPPFGAANTAAELKESVSQIFQNYGSQLSAVGAVRSSSQEAEHGIQRYTQQYDTQQYTAVQKYTSTPPEPQQAPRSVDQTGYQQYGSQIPYQSYPGYQ